MKKTIIFLILLFFITTYEKIEIVDMFNYKLQQKTIEIKGEVNHPGVYKMNIHDTLEILIKQSGGITEEADISSLNLTTDLENNSVVVIPKKEEEKRISINSGSVEELDSLPGVGPAIAERIVQYRKKKPFQRLEDLMEIKGIGEKMFDKIKDRLSL